MRYELATIAVIAVALTATASLGQETAPIATVLPPPSFPYSPPEAWHDHSSTALEGALRGTGVVIRAQGEKNLLDAQALLKIEEARTRYLENRVRFVRDQHEIKEIKYNYRQLERQRTLAKRQQSQQLKPLSDQEVAASFQLSALEFNPTTGAIAWPSGLASPRYAAYRHRIGMLLEQMIQYNVAGDEFYQNELAKVCDQLSEQLHDNASETGTLRDTQYHAAVRFVTGLKYMPHLLSSPMGELVAMNH